MLLILLFVVFIYCLPSSPSPHSLSESGEVASYSRRRVSQLALDGLIVGTALVIILGWFYIYAQARGRTMWVPDWVEGFRLRLYVLFMNRLYADECYQSARSSGHACRP